MFGRKDKSRSKRAFCRIEDDPTGLNLNSSLGTFCSLMERQKHESYSSSAREKSNSYGFNEFEYRNVDPMTSMMPRIESVRACSDKGHDAVLSLKDTFSLAQALPVPASRAYYRHWK